MSVCVRCVIKKQFGQISTKIDIKRILNLLNRFSFQYDSDINQILAAVVFFLFSLLIEKIVNCLNVLIGPECPGLFQSSVSIRFSDE